MVEHKAEIIEREYVRRLFNEVSDNMREMNANISPIIPEQMRDAIIQIVAIEVVAMKIAVSAKWN